MKKWLFGFEAQRKKLYVRDCGMDILTKGVEGDIIFFTQLRFGFSYSCCREKRGRVSSPTLKPQCRRIRIRIRIWIRVDNLNQIWLSSFHKSGRKVKVLYPQTVPSRLALQKVAGRAIKVHSSCRKAEVNCQQHTSTRFYHKHSISVFSS